MNRAICALIYKIKFKMVDPYPNERYSDFNSYWVDYASEYPRRADVETTNMCDARCLCCNAYKLTGRKHGIMSLEKFMFVADLLKKHGTLIRGMYTTGNPLLDPTLFEKFAYARKIGVMANYVSLNTTTSKLTPELHQKILNNTDNITLSFFHVGSEFERLTGLNWKQCYQNALYFIRARDKYRPDYRIFIGCNPVEGSSLKDVKKAFEGYNVEWAIDAELRWSGSVITGVVDRAVMYPTFRCDGHEGVLEIKWNGDIEACSYDFHAETCFANIFKDSWEQIKHNFFYRWQQPFSLCARCDYYHLYWKVKKNRFKYVPEFDWQTPFLKEGESFQR